MIKVQDASGRIAAPPPPDPKLKVAPIPERTKAPRRSLAGEVDQKIDGRAPSNRTEVFDVQAEIVGLKKRVAALETFARPPVMRMPTHLPEIEGVPSGVDAPFGKPAFQQVQEQLDAAEAKRRGRPSIGKPWLEMDPPISRSAYFAMRKKDAANADL